MQLMTYHVRTLKFTARLSPLCHVVLGRCGEARGEATFFMGVSFFQLSILVYIIQCLHIHLHICIADCVVTQSHVVQHGRYQ